MAPVNHAHPCERAKAGKSENSLNVREFWKQKFRHFLFMYDWSWLLCLVLCLPKLPDSKMCLARVSVLDESSAG